MEAHSMPETLETLARRISALPTKADLEAFATKADLEGFATKADLERFATKPDLERFATKTDLGELKSQLRTVIEALRDDVKRLYDVVIAQDARNTTNNSEHNAFRKQLDAHDIRILALEKNKRRV
jgi:predicted RNA-binding Zn ribbon-like protein